MRHWIRSLMIGTLVVGALPLRVYASSEMDLLLNKLIEKGILTNGEATTIRQEVVTQAQETTAKAPASQDTLPNSSRNWKWAGDFRLREEYRNRTGTGQDVNRQRLRFRYGFDAQAADALKVGARLATGNTTSPISTNQSLNVSFNHVNILLDRAYAEWSPAVPGLNECKFTGGIIANPFWTVGQLVWDEDLNFQGGAVHLAKNVGPVTFFTNDGVFSLQNDVSEAAALWSTQSGVIYKPFADSREEVVKNLKFTGTVAYHDYQNVTRTNGKNTALATAGGSLGNSANLKDVNLLNPALEIASQYQGVPFSGYTDYVHNTGAAVKNNGFQIGLKLNKATVPWDLKKGWEAGWYFERLESDATLGAFTDSDFGNGGTNHLGNAYWFKLAALKNSIISFKYFNTRQVVGSKNRADTAQVDWVTSF